MSKSVDERVVEMRFDNAKFEKNVQTSLGTLDKLKSALNFDKSTKSIEGMQRSFASIDFSKFANNVQAIADRFSTFGIVGDQVIRRITDGFLNLGNTIVKTAKELSIDQIAAGWSKYGEKTSAVQTIMAATAKDFTDTGVQMEYVNDQLDKLNWFTDETSYNFLDMVNNIGKFTSNAVDLKTSVTAMQGISTWAAISGANTAEAGRAMYNLSQAIAVGSVKLMDWKSIENANMATAEFKQTAIDTAVALGTLTKTGDGTYKTLKGNEVSAKNFNSALSDAWFSSEVLLKTLDQYGGFSNYLFDASEKTSMTATELLKAVDSYREGSLDITKVSKRTGIAISELDEMFKNLSSDQFELGRRAFKAAQEAKTFKEAIDSVKDAVSTGWMNSFELIFGNYQEAKKLWTSVAEGLYDIFASGAEARNDLLAEWHNSRKILGVDGVLTGYEAFSEAIDNILQGLVNIKSLLGEIFDDILPSINVDTFLNATKHFYNFSNSFRNFFDPDILNSEDSIKDIDNKINQQKKLLELQKINEKKNKDTSRSTDNGGEAKYLQEIESLEKEKKLLERGLLFKDILSGLVHFVNLLRKGVETLKNSLLPMKSVADSLLNAGLKIGAALGRLIGRIDDSTEATDGFVESTKIVADFLSKWIDYIGDFVSNIIDMADALMDGNISLEELSDKLGISGETAKRVKKIFDGILSVFSFFKNIVVNIKNAIPSFIGLIGKVIGSVGYLIGSLLSLIGIIDKQSEKTNVLKGFLDSLSNGYDKIANFIQKFGEKIEYFGSIVIQKVKEVWKSVNKYFEDKNINIFDALFGGALGTGIFVTVFNFIKKLKDNVDNASSVIDNLKGIVSSIKGVLDSVSDALNAFQNSLNARALLSLAEAIGILSVSLWLLSTIDAEKLAPALFSITGLFGDLLGMIAIMNSFLGKKGLAPMLAISKMMIRMSEAMLILSVSMKILSSIETDKMFISLGAIIVAFGAFAGFLELMKLISGKEGIKGIKQIAKSLISISVSILILSVAMKVFSTMSWEGLAKGAAAIIVFLAAVAGFAALTKTIGALNFAVITISLVVMAAALLALSGVMLIFSAMSWEGLGKGAAAIAGLLLIFAGFGALAGIPLVMAGLIAGSLALLIAVPAIVALVGAIALISKIENVWASIGALATALVALAVGLTLMIVALPGALALTAASKGLLVLSGALAVLAQIPFKSLMKALLVLAGGFAVIFMGGLALGIISPLLLAAATAMLIFAVAVGIIGVAIGLLASGFAMLAVSGTLGAKAFIESLRTILIGFVNLRTDLFKAVVVLVDAVVTALTNEIPKIADGIATVITEVLRILSEYTPQIIDYLFDFLIGLVDGINNRIQELIDSVIVLLINILNGIANGIRDHASDVAAAIKNIFGSLLEAALVILRDLLKDSPITAALKFFGFDLEKSINDSIDQIREIAPPVTAKKKAKEYTKAVADGAKEGKKDIDNTSKSIVEGISENFDILKNKGRSGGRGLTEEFGEGLIEGLPNVTSGFNGIELTGETFYKKVQLLSGNAGEDSAGFFMDGFIGGLTSKDKLNKIEAAAENVGKTAYNKLNMSVQIKSPSKLTEQSGKFFDMGFANGITDNVSIVQTASNLLGKASINSMSEAISKACDIIDNDMDTTPVIRPVIDLTDVENGANSLNRIFSNQNGSLIGAKFNPLSYYDPNSGSSRTINYGGVSITINAAQGQNAKEIADAVMERIQIETEQRSRARA